MITELRTYHIKRGHMAEWLERWAESAAKNVELGIRIEFAGVDPESQGTFVWARSPTRCGSSARRSSTTTRLVSSMSGTRPADAARQRDLRTGLEPFCSQSVSTSRLRSSMPSKLWYTLAKRM